MKICQFWQFIGSMVAVNRQKIGEEPKADAQLIAAFELFCVGNLSG